MTREVAIDLLDNLIGMIEDNQNNDYDCAFKMAIEALKECEEHENTFEWCNTCKEYDIEKHCCHRFTKVIRNTVAELDVVHCHECEYGDCVDKYDEYYCRYWNQGGVYAYNYCSNAVRREVPTADVRQNVQGEWMYLYEDNYKCSICGSWWCCTDSQIDEMNYCPNCGADMRGKNDD